MITLEAAVAQLKELPEEERAKITAEVQKRTAHMRWLPNPGPQTDAFFCHADELFYGGEAGGGKGLRKQELVLTPTGWKEIGKLKRGSLICAPDGTATKIIGYFERGTQPLYRIRFHDESEAVCDADHIWLAWEARGSRKINNAVVSGEAGAKKWVTRDIAQHYASGGPRLAIPALGAPACFNVAGGLIGKSNFVGRVVPAYVLGVLIGDGCITRRSNGATFFTADPQVAQEVSDELVTHLSSFPGRLLGAAYRIPSAAIVPALDALKLWGCRAETKYIPRIYLFAPTPERWALLQGLMDTDGWADQDGDCYYCTVSPQLRDDVAHLARSLGAIVTVTEKNPTYTYEGEKLKGQKAYALRIKINDPARMFRLERKKVLCAHREQQSMGRFIESIEPAGEGETVCIAVEHPSSLFIVHDFIVTHNTDLLLGTALNNHRRSLILRRLNAEVDGLVDRMEEIVGSSRGIKRSPPQNYRTREKIILFGGCQNESDWQKYQGRPKDFIGLDEITRFSRNQYKALIAWARSTWPGQRVRVISAGNPPMTPEGMWVIEYWAPWLDPDHPNPALPGELRWFTTIGDKDTEVEGPGPVILDGKPYLDEKGKPIMPKSRTFIPAQLADNPDLDESGYGAQLAALPPELRRSLKEGEFRATLDDAEFQVFPGEWIDAAMNRWKPEMRQWPMTTLGVDVAQGGPDSTAMCPRHEPGPNDPTNVKYFFDTIKVWSGRETPDGPIVAGHVVAMLRDSASVSIDMGGGYGISTRDQLRNKVPVEEYNGAHETSGRDRTGLLLFHNKRAAAHWHLKELLDPVHGANIALPPDPQLKQEMLSVRYIAGRKIQIEPKETIRARLGRSPDRMDAVIQAAFAKGQTGPSRFGKPAMPAQAMTSGNNPRRR